VKREQRIQSLISFISHEYLEDQDIGLDEFTPLLQYGIINSVTLLSLLAFIESDMDVRLNASEIQPNNLSTISSIADLCAVMEARSSLKEPS